MFHVDVDVDLDLNLVPGFLEAYPFPGKPPN